MIGTVSAFVVKLFWDPHRIFSKLQVVVIADGLRSHSITLRSLSVALVS